MVLEYENNCYGNSPFQSSYKYPLRSIKLNLEYYCEEQIGKFQSGKEVWVNELLARIEIIPYQHSVCGGLELPNSLDAAITIVLKTHHCVF